MSRILAAALVVVFALAFVPEVEAQFGSFIAGVNQGSGSGIFNTQNLIGGPTGGGTTFGSLDILTLGAGGSVTVGFAQGIADGKGVDFTVFENPFEYPAEFVFSEVAYVEVSTDGLNFARFPSRYLGPNAAVPTYGTLPAGSYEGLAGSLPVMANVMTGFPFNDPFNPVFSGGDAFDLADLTNDPLVIGGQVDLGQINFVRLIDVVAGQDVDSSGAIIFDSHDGSGSDSADFDAIAVINAVGAVPNGQPEVRFFLDPTGHLRLRIEDEDGITDLDNLSFMGSFNLRNFTPQDLFFVYDLWSIDGLGIEFRSKVPAVSTNFFGVCAVGIADLAGNFSFDQFVLPG